MYLQHRDTGEIRSVTVSPRTPRVRDRAKSAFTTIERNIASEMRDHLRAERYEAVAGVLERSGVARSDQMLQKPLTKTEVRVLRKISRGENVSQATARSGGSFAKCSAEEATEILRQDMLVRNALSGLDADTVSLIKMDEDTMWSGEFGVKTLKEALGDPDTEQLAKGIITAGATIAAVRGSSLFAEAVLQRTEMGSTSELLSSPARVGALIGCANAAISSAFVEPMVRLHSILDPRDLSGMSEEILSIGRAVIGDSVRDVVVPPIPINGKISAEQRAVLEDELVMFSTSLALRQPDRSSEESAERMFRMQYEGLSDAQLCGLAYEMLESTSEMVESVGSVARQIHASDFQRAMRSVDGMTEEAAAILSGSSLQENIRKHVERDGGVTLMRMLDLAERDIRANPQKHANAIATHAASLLFTADQTASAGSGGADANKQANEMVALARTLVESLSKGVSGVSLPLVLVEAQRAAVASLRAEAALRDAALQGDDNPIRRSVTDLVNVAVVGLSSGSAGLRDQRLSRAVELASAVSDQQAGKEGASAVESLSVAAVKAVSDPSIMPAIHHNAAPARRAAAGRDWRTGSKSVESKTLAAMMSAGWEIV